MAQIHTVASLGLLFWEEKEVARPASAYPAVGLGSEPAGSVPKTWQLKPTASGSKLVGIDVSTAVGRAEPHV